MLINPKERRKERELLNNYKEYLKDMIRLNGINPDRCKFDNGRVSVVAESVTAGGAHPKSFGVELNYWERIPSPEFDKDSCVYLRHTGWDYGRFVVNAIKGRRVVVVGCDCPADSDR